MDTTGLRAATAVTSSLHWFRASSLRPFLSFRLKPNSFHFPLSHSSPRFSPLCSLSERGRVNALPNGLSEVVTEVPQSKFLQVVLVSPQIPGNTGCIARTCAASSVGLHLVEPLGFQVDDTKLKRAGLDYWPYTDWWSHYSHTLTLFLVRNNAEVKIFPPFILDTPRADIVGLYVVVKVHSSWSEFREYFRQQEGEKRLLAFTKRGTNIHSEYSYRRGDWLVFGSETSGLPPEALHDCNSESLGGGTIRIPMVETYVRCLNLSVSVGIALYEASRQLNYEQLHNVLEPCMDSETPLLTEDIFA